jgi:hypothetical protein
MTTNHTSRAAADFDRALSGGRADGSTAALVAVAGALAALPQRSAPAFREALRTKLMAEAAASAASAPAASIPAQPAARPPVKSLAKAFQHPAMQIATGGLAATIAATGVGVGASRSLPGDTLYGLKRTLERLRSGAASGDTAEAGALLTQAQERLDEVRALLGQGDLTGATLDRVEATLRDLKEELRGATARLLNAARDGSRAAYDELNRTAVELANQLAALLPDLPDGAAAATASASLATLNAARALLAALPRPDGPGPTVPVGPTPTSVTTTPAPPTSTGPSTPVRTTTPPPPTSTGPSTPVSVPVTTPPISVPVTTPPPITLPPTPTLPQITPPPLLP